jgi:hypothetical protein
MIGAGPGRLAGRHGCRPQPLHRKTQSVAARGPPVVARKEGRRPVGEPVHLDLI